MKDGLDRVLVEHRGNGLGVGQVALELDQLVLDAEHPDRRRAFVEPPAVERDHPVAPFEQRLGEPGADEAAPSRDQ